MFSRGFILFTLLAGIVANINGIKQPGITLPASIAGPVTAKLKSIINKCSGNSSEFNLEEAKATISSCVQRFNELGEVEHEYPEVKYPSNWEDEAEVSEYRKRRNDDNALHVKNLCGQLTSTIECFDPIKSIVDKYQSSEGISLFSLGAEMCKNDGQPIFDYGEAIQPCVRTTEFRNGFDSCESEHIVQRFAYFGRKFDPATPIFEFCKLGSFMYKCFREGLDASPLKCAEATAFVQAFTKGVLDRASNAEAVTQCFLNTD